MIRKLKKIFFIVIVFIVRHFTSVKSNRVLCWSYGFSQYSCNPRYIAEYLSQNHSDKFEIYWVQRNNTDISLINSSIKLVRPYTFSYFLLLNTAKFIITNTRTDKFNDFFFKKHKQIYIQTWHGLIPLKKIEKDAEDVLTHRYIKNAKRDSKICDLILSGSKFSSENIRKSFWYSGEILEKGLPRNEILFSDVRELRYKIFSRYNIPECSKVLLYAPTFRSDFSLEYYNLNWDSIISIINAKFSADYYILLRLHPNILACSIDANILLTNGKIVNATKYPDMQELLCVSDILITDYSSSMFEAGIMKKPCFLYIPDSDKYDRGFYFNFENLPFPISKSQEELINNIRRFDYTKYIATIDTFNDTVGIFSSQNANVCLYNWMKTKV